MSTEDVAFLDEHARRSGLPSRSAALHDAVRRLRQSDLGDEYAAAWAEWEVSGDGPAWDSVSGDGLS